MTDCLDAELKDSLPLMAHDALSVAERARVSEHLDRCAECRDELSILVAAVAAVDAATPAISVASITAAVQRATIGEGRSAERAPLRLQPVDARRAQQRARRRTAWVSRPFLAAAASLVLVVTLSLTVLTRTFGPATGTMVGGIPDSSIGLTDSAGEVRLLAAASFGVTGGLADLSDEDLATLLVELEEVDATVEAEPVSMRRALVDEPGGF